MDARLEAVECAIMELREGSPREQEGMARSDATLEARFARINGYFAELLRRTKDLGWNSDRRDREKRRWEKPNEGFREGGRRREVPRFEGGRNRDLRDWERRRREDSVECSREFGRRREVPKFEGNSRSMSKDEGTKIEKPKSYVLEKYTRMGEPQRRNSEVRGRERQRRKTRDENSVDAPQDGTRGRENDYNGDFSRDFRSGRVRNPWKKLELLPSHGYKVFARLEKTKRLFAVRGIEERVVVSGPSSQAEQRRQQNPWPFLGDGRMENEPRWSQACAEPVIASDSTKQPPPPKPSDSKSHMATGGSSPFEPHWLCVAGETLRRTKGEEQQGLHDREEAPRSAEKEKLRISHAGKPKQSRSHFQSAHGVYGKRKDDEGGKMASHKFGSGSNLMGQAQLKREGTATDGKNWGDYGSFLPLLGKAHIINEGKYIQVDFQATFSYYQVKANLRDDVAFILKGTQDILALGVEDKWPWDPGG